jgi:hypothetical protein
VAENTVTKHTMSREEIDSFGKKFETWTSQLTDKERTFLQWVIQTPKTMDNDPLDKLTGGAVQDAYSFTALGGFSFNTFAPRLDYDWLAKLNTVAGW